MPYVLSVSPDFNTKYVSGWFVFNTWLQKTLNEQIHFELFDDFAAQHKAVDENKINLIYANPYDASKLVREKGFVAVARPTHKPDEAVIAAKAGAGITCVEDLKAGARIATTDDPDVHMMCMIMIEPANLNRGNVTLTRKENYVMVAKDLMKGQADAGFFLAETFDDLSDMIRGQLQVLVRSQIHVIHHVFLVDPGLASRSDEITRALTGMGDAENSKRILSDIGVPGWEPVEREDVEFMIDLMSTLVD